MQSECCSLRLSEVDVGRNQSEFGVISRSRLWSLNSKLQPRQNTRVISNCLPVSGSSGVTTVCSSMNPSGESSQWGHHRSSFMVVIGHRDFSLDLSKHPTRLGVLRDRVEPPTCDFLVQPRKLTKTFQTVQNEVIEMVGREFRGAVLKVG